jgi:hypothetical protein
MPTLQEVEEHRWLVLTSAMEWDPNEPTFTELEANQDAGCHIKADHNILALLSSPGSLTNPYDEHDLCQCAIHLVNISYQKNCNLLSTASSDRCHNIIVIDLARKLNVGLQTAEQTLHVTAQKWIHDVIHPIHRSYRTKQAQLRYNQLSGRHGHF